MTTTPPDTPTEPSIHDGPRVSREEIRDLGRLRRSRADRKIAGVAGGLARHLDMDPLIVRVALVVLVFFGGAGLIVYGACWLLLPDDVSGSAPVRLDERSRSAVLIIVGALALLVVLGDAWGGYGPPWPLAVVGVVAIVLLSTGGSTPVGPAHSDQPPGVAPPPAEASGPVGATAAAATPVQPAPRRASNPRRRGPILFWFTLALVVFSEGLLGMADMAGAGVTDSAYAALAVGLIGLMLVLGAFIGRAGGLILAGLLATVILIGATIFDRWDGDSLRETPVRASAVSAEYRMDAGELIVDLRSVADPQELDGRTLSVVGEVGHLQVIVPRDLDVRVVANVTGAGDIVAFDQNTDGVDVDLITSYDGGTDVAALTVDAELALGQIEVTHR